MMWDVAGTIAENNAAVIRHYAMLLRDGNLAAAKAVRDANPDLERAFNKVDKDNG